MENRELKEIKLADYFYLLKLSKDKKPKTKSLSDKVLMVNSEDMIKVKLKNFSIDKKFIKKWN